MIGRIAAERAAGKDLAEQLERDPRRSEIAALLHASLIYLDVGRDDAAARAILGALQRLRDDVRGGLRVLPGGAS